MSDLTPAMMQEMEQHLLAYFGKQQEYQSIVKENNKKIAKIKKEIKKYMQQNKITEYTLAGRTFSFEKKESVVLTMDRIEKSFDSEAVQKYKKDNYDEKIVFKVD